MRDENNIPQTVCLGTSIINGLIIIILSVLTSTKNAKLNARSQKTNRMRVVCNISEIRAEAVRADG